MSNDPSMVRPFVYEFRHPVTHRRHYMRARTRAERETYKHRIAELRNALRLGTRTAEQVSDELRGLRVHKWTFQTAAESYLRLAHLGEQTRERVRSELRNMGELLPVRLLELRRERIAKHLSKRAEKVGQTTLSLEWRTIHRIIRHAVDVGWLDAVPYGDWRPGLARGVPRFREACRTPAELARLLEAARAMDDGRTVSVLDPRTRERFTRRGDLEPLIACAALLGLRQGELAGLKWSDVHAERGTVTIARQWAGKPVKESLAAAISASSSLFERLERWRAEMRPEPEWPIFAAPGHPHEHRKRGENPINVEMLRRAVTGAGLPNPRSWTAHSLRDTFVTLELLSRRGDLSTVMARSRHVDIRAALRYVHTLTRETASPLELEERPPAAPVALPPDTVLLHSELVGPLHYVNDEDDQ